MNARRPGNAKSLGYPREQFSFGSGYFPEKIGARRESWGKTRAEAERILIKNNRRASGIREKTRAKPERAWSLAHRKMR
jgi:hypothetical protein